MMLAQRLRVHRIRTPFDAAIRPAAEKLSIVAATQAATLRLLHAAMFRTDDSSKSLLIVMPRAQIAMVGTVATPLDPTLPCGRHLIFSLHIC